MRPSSTSLHCRRSHCLLQSGSDAAMDRSLNCRFAEPCKCVFVERLRGRHVRGECQQAQRPAKQSTHTYRSATIRLDRRQVSCWKGRISEFLKPDTIKQLCGVQLEFSGLDPCTEGRPLLWSEGQHSAVGIHGHPAVVAVVDHWQACDFTCGGCRRVVAESRPQTGGNRDDWLCVGVIILQDLGGHISPHARVLPDNKTVDGFQTLLSYELGVVCINGWTC